MTVKQPVSSGKPTTKVPASTNTVTHKVSYGESLWLISSKYGVTVDELRKQNGIKGDLIHPGQVLVVKKGTTTSHSTPAGKSGTSYTVKAGDSVWLIANRYGVSMDDLVKWNKIKNYTIHPGQVLTIQTIVSTPAKPAITTTPKVEAKPAITTTPKVEAKPAITTTPKVESKPGVTTTPKVDEKPVITTIPKVKEQPVVTTVPKTESEVLVEKASGADVPKVDVSKLKESATLPKKGGETVVGHALQKHAGRNPDIWGKIKGNAQEINKTAMRHLEEILNAPGDFKVVKTKNGVSFLEKQLQDGRGIRLNMDGSFKGFIDQIR